MSTPTDPTGAPSHNADAPSHDAPASSSPEQPVVNSASADSPAAPATSGAPASSTEAPTRRSSLPMAPMLAALAVGALVGGVAGGGVTAGVLASTNSPSVVQAQPAAITVNDTDDATVVTGVVATTMPSVVTLQVQGGGTAGNGSGVILSDDGYVLTNNHVATLEGATSDPTIRVTLSDGRIFDAELIGSDPIADLAVVKLEGASDLPVIEFADSDALNVGDRAIVIGAPLGLSGSVSDGIVSALNRSITVRSSAVPEQTAEQPPTESPEGDTFDFWDFDIPGQDESPNTGGATASQTISLPVIQTDAAINPGNSGGALLNDQGQLIGIVVALASTGGSSGAAGSIGVGFSIPSNFAQRVANELIADGTASHGLLGANVTDSINDAGSDVIGALVDSVTPGGAADLAGLRSGDVITTFNGVPITGAVDLTAQVRTLAAGDSAEVVYVRSGNAQTATVTVGELQ